LATRPLGHDSDHDRARRRAGDGVADGGGDRQGLSDLIREEFGFRVTFFLMLALVVTNFGNIMAEFAGVASSLGLFLPMAWAKYVGVPLAAAIVWLLVVQGTYSSVEKIFLVASGFYVCYIVAGVLAHPDWRTATMSMVTSPEAGGFRNYGYVFMLIGLVGTTIAPWMQFYLQSSIVERLTRHSTGPRGGTSSSAACSRRSWRGSSSSRARRRCKTGARYSRAADAAEALCPLAGNYAYLLFAAGLFNASLLRRRSPDLVAAVCRGWFGPAHKKFHEAPVFYWLYTCSSSPA
jgi:Mn2+/Fe2+ NRAMP family transporter